MAFKHCFGIPRVFVFDSSGNICSKQPLQGAKRMPQDHSTFKIPSQNKFPNIYAVFLCQISRKNLTAIETGNESERCCWCYCRKLCRQGLLGKCKFFKELYQKFKKFTKNFLAIFRDVKFLNKFSKDFQCLLG